MDWQTIVIGIVLVLIICLFIFRKQIGRWFQSLYHDYVLDWGLSTLDNFIGGFAGLDIGDWIAAILVFKGEKKVVGTFWALVVAWEVTNFIPFSFIPGIGEGLEIITNLIPSATIARFFAAKYGSAEKLEHTLEEEEEAMKEEHMSVKEVDAAINHIKELIHKNNPVAALALEKQIDKAVTKKLRTQVDKLVKEVEQEINQVVQQQPEGDVEIMQILQQGIGRAQELLKEAKQHEDKKEFKEALSKAKLAQKSVVDAVNIYNQEEA